MPRLAPTLSALLLALAFGQSLAAETLQLQGAQLKALGISTVRVAEATPGRQGLLPGRVVIPNAQLRILAAPLAGMIEHLAVAPGMPVKKGQILARLAAPQALEAQRDLQQANSQSGLLQRNLQRDEQLFAEGLIAESRLQAARAAAVQANAQLQERRAALSLIGLPADSGGGSMALRAPIDGVVLEQGAQLGQRVEANTPIYRIGRLSPLWIEVQAPAELATKLHAGDKLSLPALNQSARLISVARTVDPASQTVLLRAELKHDTERLQAGQIVEISVSQDEADSAALPASAIVRHNGKILVFVEQESGPQGMRLEVRSVTLAGEQGEQIRVRGLKAEERVVVSGTSGLKAMLAGVGRE